jgi:hypothetical protein
LYAPGNIIAGLNPVNGDTGISKHTVATLVGGAAVTYTQFLTQNAYVNVHLSTEQWLPWWHKVTSDQTYLVLNQKRMQSLMELHVFVLARD